MVAGFVHLTHTLLSLLASAFGGLPCFKSGCLRFLLCSGHSRVWQALLQYETILQQQLAVAGFLHLTHTLLSLLASAFGGLPCFKSGCLHFLLCSGHSRVWQALLQYETILQQQLMVAGFLHLTHTLLSLLASAFGGLPCFKSGCLHFLLCSGHSRVWQALLQYEKILQQQLMVAGFLHLTHTLLSLAFGGLPCFKSGCLHFLLCSGHSRVWQALLQYETVLHEQSMIAGFLHLAHIMLLQISALLSFSALQVASPLDFFCGCSFFLF